VHKAVSQGVDDALILPHSQESRNFTIEQDQMWMVFESLSPGLKYEAAVRARPRALNIYKGVWSDWSETILWRTHADRKDQSQAVWLGGETGDSVKTK